MMVLIGRDQGSSRLVMKVNGQPVWYSQKTDVPSSVSTNHCTIEQTGNVIRLKSLDLDFDTFVNGQPVQSKTVSQSDKIELGADHYPLDWTAIHQVIPPVVNIHHLQKVWNDYDEHRMDQQIADRRFNSLRSATGIITMAAIALSMMLGRQSFWYIILYVFAILVSLVLTIKAYRDATAVPQKMQKLSKQFQKDYVCPHCHRFLGNQSYDLLEQNTCCPYCKTKFIH